MTRGGGGRGGTAGGLTLLVVVVDGEEYALPVARVREVTGYTRPRPLPRADRHVRGVIDLRGEVIPVVSARAAFGLPDAPAGDDTRVVVLDRDGGPTGLIVDAVNEVTQVDPAAAVAPPAHAGAEAARAVERVVRTPGGLVVVLDVDAVLGPPPADGPGDAELVRRAHDLMRPHAARAADTFALRLRETSPDAHAAMRLDDPARRDALVAALGDAVAALPDTAAARAAVAAAGAAGAPADVVDAALDAAAWTLARGLGSRFTPEMRAACTRTGRALLTAEPSAEG